MIVIVSLILLINFNSKKQCYKSTVEVDMYRDGEKTREVIPYIAQCDHIRSFV